MKVTRYITAHYYNLFEHRIINIKELLESSSDYMQLPEYKITIEIKKENK